MPSECDEFGREVPFGSKQRAASPPLFEHHNESHYRKSRRSGDSPSPRQRSFPCDRYVQGPMLCQYVWKAQQERERHARDVEDMAMDDERARALPFASETYDEYRQRYCLTYIRAFFNEHMDDSWFRNRFSPLDRKRVVMQHLERAANEAQKISLDLVAAPAHFVEQARLGYGVKDISMGVNSAPGSHVFSIWDRVVKINGIPPHVSEKQIILALLDHSSNPNAQIRIFSEAVKINDDKNYLFRDAFCVFESAEVKNDIISNTLQNREPTDGKAEGQVPRKDETRKSIELDVECADPYGRLEIDDEAGGTVPRMKVTIFIAQGGFTQKVVVLSGAVSSKTRIAKDKDSALLIAQALDHKQKIPKEYRLDNLIQTLGCQDEDALDVSIAYLRRVHLFSFYNGCVFSDNLADVLGGHHPASTIHLRLKDADEILRSNKGHGNAPNVAMELPSDANDLLVKRLDESIRKVLEKATEWMTNDWYINPEIDAEASDIEELEKESAIAWVQQHSIQEDSRARCGFHFCRKLFKEMSFLEKHLHKKHSEFLQAEIAKCHDSYMMRAWDSGDIRPVPSILVDCGSEFGFKPSQVIGAATPMAEDPEPELWKEKQEREAQRESQRHRHRHHRDSDGDGDGPLVPTRRSNDFEDVDDMKEEKVALSFESVDVPVQPPKKKKRKKLL